MAAATNYVKVVHRGRIDSVFPFDGRLPYATKTAIQEARERSRELARVEGMGSPRVVLWGAPRQRLRAGDPAEAPISCGSGLIDPGCDYRKKPCGCVQFVGCYAEHGEAQHELIASAGEREEAAR